MIRDVESDLPAPLQPAALAELSAEHALRLAQPREMTAPERAEFWTRLFREPYDEMQETWPERLNAAWRVCRELARLKGLFDEERPSLWEATRISPDPWSTPNGIFSGAALDDALVRAIGERQMPLLPKDDPLGWLELADLVADRVSLRWSAAGKRAAPLLLSPSYVEIAWPSAMQIMDYEITEANRVLRLLLESAPTSVIEDLMRDGYRRHEAMSLVQLAHWIGRAAQKTDPDLERCMMSLRLQKVAERSRESGQTRDELAALRLLASVQGLIKSGSGDEPDAEDRAMSATARALPPPPRRSPAKES